MADKWKCGLCDEITTNDKLLVGQNPFDPTLKVYGCPVCKAVGDFTAICDEPECKREASCGFPTPNGYRSTCGDHYKPTPPNP